MREENFRKWALEEIAMLRARAKEEGVLDEMGGPLAKLEAQVQALGKDDLKVADRITAELHGIGERLSA